jgi:hypothetical protein
MSAQDARQKIAEFLASGRSGSIVLHIAPGQPGHRGTIATVEIHDRLSLSRGESDEGLLDIGGIPGVVSR